MQRSGHFRDELAPRIAPVVLSNITTIYPYHDAHVYRRQGETFDPIAAHPAFGNSFDWHSSVHSHWTALHVLAYIEASGLVSFEVEPLREAVARNLTATNVSAEWAYLSSQPTYERPYGWAWALQLAAAIETLGVDVVAAPRPAMREFAEHLAAAAVRWLAVLPAPIRHGVHSNTAFALGLMLDAARELYLGELEFAILTFANRWYLGDRDYPDEWERGGYDFLSGGLAEADLMRRVLHNSDFLPWWRDFLPSLSDDSMILEVAEVPAATDGQVVHLHGLNLSRAAMLARIAMPTGGDARLIARAQRLYGAALEHVDGADYLSTHWLPTFAWDAARSLDVTGGVR